MELFQTTSGGTLALLLLCLAIALGFECVNGFHDTANAVATVIYTRSLKPTYAVIWSGFLNFLGVITGGTAVAFSIVHLLPVDLLINIGDSAGLFMVLSLLISAMIWNLSTWYLGLPASSSHALIGSILGVGLASSYFSGAGFGSGVNWGKAEQIGLTLLVSPLIGFVLAGGLLLLAKRLIKNPELYQEPHGDTPPPLWIRGLLILTCSGVSFAHGSNDGQKGIGLIMLILIGLLPMSYAVDPYLSAKQINKTRAAIHRLEARAASISPGLAVANSADGVTALQDLQLLEARFSGIENIHSIPGVERKAIRNRILRVDDALDAVEKKLGKALAKVDKKAIDADRAQLRGVVDYVTPWVIIAVALALGVGTTIGWHRIVVTVGEKIGKTHLTYAQGASAELVAMVTIWMADYWGLPVSTTHVLSSGVAGTMAANRSGLQVSTIRNIALAWVLTLPVTMLLSGLLFSITAGNSVRKMGVKARVQSHNSRVQRKLE